MITKTRFYKRALRSVVALPIAIAVILAATPAMAASVSGPIIQIEYNAGTASNPMLFVQVSTNSVNYFAQLSSPGCSLPTLSLDTIKIFVSIAQAALLAGKPTTVYYNTCNSVNYISDIVMTR